MAGVKVVKENIGNAAILIRTIDSDEELQIVGEESSGRKTIVTGITDKTRVEDAYAKAKSVIINIAEDIGKQLKDLKYPTSPKEVEMEFNIGFSAQFGMWILSGTGDYSLKVKITWALGEDKQK